MEEKSKYEKAIQRRGWLLFGLSWAIMMACEVAGICAGVDRTVAKAVLSICAVIAASMLPLNLLLYRKFDNKLRKLPVGALQKMVLEQKARAAEVSAELLHKRETLHRVADMYAVCLGLCGCGIAFGAGAAMDVAGAVLFGFLSMFFLLAALSRIRFREPESAMGEPEDLLREADYPTLYALAKKARDAVGCVGDVQLDIYSGEFNCGIGRVGDTYYIGIGATMLRFHSEQELYNVLLHEFGHMAENDSAGYKEKLYYMWLERGGTYHCLSVLTMPLFKYLDSLYAFQTAIYDYACSVMNEEQADRAVREYGSVAHAASSLIKMKYYDLFFWEQGTRDRDNAYASEEPTMSPLEVEFARFEKAMETRTEDWDELLWKEIPARNDTHPTVKMRLEALSVTDLQLMPYDDSPAFAAEREKALRHIDARMNRNDRDWYKTTREERYLKPLQAVTEWEEAGKPLDAERYAHIDTALRILGRTTEANALCERAIAELPPAASCYAYFMRGCYRVRCYDEGGIEDLYHAIENNTNYIEEGLDTIGRFCCLTGRQEQLDSYRERALTIAQQDRDVYSEMRFLRRKDNLTAEQALPTVLRNGILRKLRETDDGCVERVYLVRKTITEDFFVTAVVIRFKKGTTVEVRDGVFSPMFDYLDTCSDWQFCLFDYEEVKQARVDKLPDSCIYPER